MTTRGSRASRPVRATAVRLATTALGAAAAAGAAVALGTCATALATASAPVRVDAVVELAVVVVGALVAAWLSGCAALAATCLAVRLFGASWRAGERAVHRWTPAMVRRTLVVAVTAGLGAGLAPSAYATVGPVPVPAGSATATATAAAPVDLGWVVTTTPTGTGRPGIPVTSSPDAGVSVGAADADAFAPGGDADGQGRPAEPVTGDVGSNPAAAAATAEPGARPTDRVAVEPGHDATPGRLDRGDANRGAANPIAASGEALETADAPEAAVRAAATGRSTEAVVVVRPGDSLWRIAARHLPAGASDEAIAAAWPRWYHANRAVVGDDPGRLLPGQVLVVPDGTVR